MRKTFLLIPALLLVPFALAACEDNDTTDDDLFNGENGAPTNGFDDDPNGLDDGMNGIDDNGMGMGEASGEEIYDFSDAESTDGGVLYIDEVTGEGAETTMDSEVQVHYQGMLLDGTLFDSSVMRGEPETFQLGQVIPGFAEGVVGMQEGGTRVMLVPSDLGYGDQGIEGIIPPDADLIFEVELLEVR